MISRFVCFAASLVLCIGAASAAAPGSAMQVLGNDSRLRSYLVFQTPVVVSSNGALSTPLTYEGKAPAPFAVFQSPLPPADWMKPSFSDATWERERIPMELGPGGGKGPAALHTATVNSLICLRGAFVVDDPAQVRDLALTMEYVGGVVVYVNGRELTRGSLPKGEVTPDTLAEKYPDDLYCEPGGLFLQEIKKNPAGFERRYRKLADVAIAPDFLRKGVNVLALEIHRAPVNEAAIAAKRVAVGGMSVTPGLWAYAGLRRLNLTAAAGSALTPNLARPAGIQVWNCGPAETVTVFDYGDGGTLLPVVLSAPRNGVFSGRLVVSSDRDIRGLRVTVSSLTSADGGVIPAAAVRVRCATAAVAGKSWVPATRCDGLFESIPAVIPVVSAKPPRELFPHSHGKYVDSGQIEVVRSQDSSGAVAPIWLTVRVPRDAKPGRYDGMIDVAAEGLAPTRAPIQVNVSAWTMPDPKDFRMQSFAYLSEDAIAKHYEVPRWSERHLALMAKSLELMAEVNARQAIVNMAINFYGGNKGAVDNSNEESIIRWIRQPDGTFKHDFTVFDRYLDMVAKAIGKPFPLRLNCWGEAFLLGGQLVPGGPGESGERRTLSVTVLDPATGKTETLAQPIPGTEESFAFWKPVLDEARRKIEARQWIDVTAMGHNSYCYPPRPEVVSNCKRLWPDAVWSYTAHNGTLGATFPGKEKGDGMPVRYSDCVWTRGKPTIRGYSALLKPRSSFWCYTFRTEARDWSELVELRDIAEEEIMSGHDGWSDFGADLFPVKRSEGRGFYCLGNGRGTGGPDCSTRALLYPGPDGAIATERFEAFREGVEIAEALLYVQRAIEGGKLDSALAQRADRLLNARGEAVLKRWQSGRIERDAQLIALAGEIAAASR